MADLLSSLSASIGGSSLDTLVSQYMALERKPVETLKTSRDQLDVRTAMFNDLKAKIDELKNLAEELALSTGSVFDSHTASSSVETAVTATATSVAADGSYLLQNVVLAKAARVSAGPVASSWTTGTGGSFTLNGTSISVASGKSLTDLRDAINGATYADGRGVVASIVNSSVGGVVQRTLVLEGKSTGSTNTIAVADQEGGTVFSSIGTLTVTQVATDASFTMNGVQVTKEKNSGISDVIDGLTLNLKAPAAEVTIQVAGDTAAMRTKVESFLQKYNALMDYVKQKSAITKGTGETYTRGLLYGYSLYTGLRSELPSLLSGPVAGIGAAAPVRLSDLGIEMDSELHFKIADGTKLDGWLQASSSGVKDLFGGTFGVARQLVDRLEPYSGTVISGGKSYLDREQDAVTAERDTINGRIDTLNERLGMREQQLRNQLTRMQALYIEMAQMQERLQSIWSATSSMT